MAAIPNNDIKLQLKLNDDGSITANWIILPGMVKQKVYVSRVKSGYGVEWNYDWLDNSYTTQAGLSANNQYDFRVEQIGEHVSIGGDVKRILIPSDFYDNKPIDVPQNIKITPQPTQISVSFDAVPRAVSYDILFDNKACGLRTLSKVFTGLKPKTSHTVAVRANGSKQSSPYSVTQTVQTLPTTPGTPLQVKRTATETTATISWTEVNGAVGYDILFDGQLYSTDTISKVFTGLEPGRSYPFQIRARNEDLAGSYTGQLSVATPPYPPASVSAVSTENSVTISWNKVTGASGYLVRCNSDETNTYSGTTSVKYDGLKPKTTYTYQVACRSSDGIGSYSAIQTIETLPKLPSIPSGISGETTESSVTIKWKPANDATGYDVLFDGSTYSTTVPSRTFTGLVDNTEYSYKVRSKNADGVSEYGVEKKVRTTPKAPSGATASSDESSVTISWSPIPGASSYDVLLDGKVYNVRGTSYRVTGLLPNTSHSYQIRVKNADGSSSYSAIKTLRTTSKPPATVNATSSHTDVTLRWDSVSGATSYDVLFDGTAYRTTGTSKTISGLKANTSYQYQVRSNNADGSSSYSPVRTVKTIPFAPTAYPSIRATVTTNTVTLSWGAVSGATEYELTFNDWIGTVKSTSYKMTGLKEDTSYSYRIRARNEGGYGGYSPYATVRTAISLPDVPTGIGANSTSDSVTIKWNRTLRAQSYDIWFNGGVYNTSALSKTFTGLRSNKTYKYQIRAKNTAGTSAYSSWRSVTTKVAPPAMPMNVRATVTTNSVTVAWNSVSGATGYKLSFQGESHNVTDTSKTITGLTPDTDYEYSVCAYNAGGNSPYTPRETITTIPIGPAVPSDVKAQAGLNSVIVSFPPVADAADYDIRFDEDVFHVSGTDMASGRICKVFSELLPNTEHTYCARANNEKGSSRYSEPGSVRTDIRKESDLTERSSDSTHTDGRISYMGSDPVNALTGAFFWRYVCLEDYGKDKLRFTLMYDSDRDGFQRPLGKKWSHELCYLLCMDEDYAYFSTPYGSVIPFAREADGTFAAPEDIGMAYAMERMEDASYSVRKQDGTEYVFDSELSLDRIQENGMVKYRFEKNQAGQTTGIITRHGDRLTLTYIGENLTGVEDAAGHETVLSYQGEYLISVRNQEGKTLSFTYDENGGLLSISDFSGQVYLENTYDAFGRVIRQNMPGRGESAVKYDDADRKTEFIDALGNATTYRYDADRHVTEVELAGSGIHNSYDENGRLTQQTDALGNSTKMSYDACGRMNVVTYPDGTWERVDYNDRNLPVRIVNRDGTECLYQYDGNNNLISAQDERGNSGVYAYDENDNLIAWTDKEGNLWSYAYDEAGQLRQATDPEGNVYSYVHDAMRRLISYTSPEGRTISYQYAATGDLLKAVDEDGEVLFTYDHNGNRTGVTDRRGNRQTLTYNDMGQLKSVTDFMGNKYQYTYDEAGNLIRETDPADEEISFAYDAAGNTTACTDRNGNVTAYAYDAANRLTKITDAAGGIRQYIYDVMGRIQTVIDPLEHQTIYTYDAQGRVISETNALGHSVSYTYDQAGNLLTRTDEDGVVTAYSYDGENRLLTETTADGVTRYTYDKVGRVTAVERPDETVQAAVYNGDGNITEIIDPESNMEARVYDTAGHLIQIIAPDGGKTVYEYDENGNCTKITDAEGNSQSYAFDANNRLTAVTDALGQTITCEYDVAGRMSAVTDARGGRRTLAYDANGNLVSETDFLGGVRTYEYDSLNRVVRSVDEEGHEKSCSYDAAGNMISFTDANGNTWNYIYDALGRMTVVTDKNGDSLTLAYTNTGKIAKVTDMEGAETVYQYDLMGRLRQMTDAAGHRLAYTYDSMGRVLTLTDAAGNVTEYAYSPAGNLISRKESEGGTVTYTYDAAGRITKETDALGGATTYTRDALGQVTMITNPEGASLVFTYTACGQIGTVTDACGNVTAYTYDACGNLTQITDPLGNITSYEYDVMNRRIKECMSEAAESVCTTIYQYDKRGCIIRMINPAAEERLYSYDGNGNLAGVTDEEGNVTTVTYDLNNQPVQMIYGDGRQATFRYNKRGELVEMQDWTGVMSMERDVLGRLTGVTDNEGRVTGYTYDAAGNRTSIRYPDKSVVNYTYDGNHRLIGVTDVEGVGTQYSYDTAGNLRSMIQPGGRVCYTYNAGRMPVTANYQTDDGGVMDMSLSYDKMGRVIEFHRQKGEAAAVDSVICTYDPMGHLLSCTEGAKCETYSFDGRGNRTAWKVNGTEKASYAYDTMNRLTAMVQDGTVYQYSYDKRGNLTEEKQDGSLIRQYIYDTANRMSSGRDLASGAQTDYVYNALHMRITNTVTRQESGKMQTGTTAYVPDILSGTANDLMAYHSGGSVTGAVYGRTYERLGITTPTGRMYEMPDLWGSPLYTTDSQGNAVWHMEHDLWGRVSGQRAAEADMRFTDYIYDPVIGKYFAQERFYDSAQGRMLSPDPVKRSLNPYPYCDNDPVNYVDPTGEIPTILAGAGLGGFFGGAAGFLDSAINQVAAGEKFNWRKAFGSAANGALVGAAKGALVGSGAGIPLAFATDFAAGSLGNALEQKITTGQVDAGASLLSGAENALSELLYGTGRLKGAGDAFFRGARTGAVMSGLKNLTDTYGGYGMAGERIFNGKPEYAVPGSTGRDPKGMCGAADPFNLAEGLGNGRGYPSGKGHGGEGFRLGGFVKDVITGGIIGGLGSAGFYGAGKAVEALRGSIVGLKTDTFSVGDAIFMDADDSFTKYISLREDVDVSGYYDVVAHGTINAIEITHNGQHILINHRTAAHLIRNSCSYNGQAIRLLSCNTGAINNGFAQNLANKLNVEVYAPTNYLWVTSKGEYFVAGMKNAGIPNLIDAGKFKHFIPGGK